ncbi:hypothetical protein E4U56_006360 [Claviceps arundinis]|uniref:Luciferase domain-containing protein n=1 Tax=Claviceps arundinis TaxID=1623583 RepID=A0A9P7MXE5_9HYPO|nr:hypothetical protein E4U56_006360 [Claviceps arundinis]
MSMTLASTTIKTPPLLAPYAFPPSPINDDDNDGGNDDKVEDAQHLLSCNVHPQKPISITLSGPHIFLLSATLLLSLRFLGPHPTECILLLTPLLVLLRNDYENFLSLGPGGTPSSMYGYLQITWWRLWALRDPFTAPSPPSSSSSSTTIGSSSSSSGGILRQLSPQQPDLPYRSGPRPIVAGIAPQRQLDQHGSRHSYQTLRRAMVKLATTKPLLFGTERSCVEKHGLALFAKHALRTNCQGEIVHVHESDHSMHMCLHSEDIEVVLRRGWGQRHPLARRGWLLRMPVSQNFVMVYAPRNQHELQIVYRIIEAAIWYTSEERVLLS